MINSDGQIGSIERCLRDEVSHSSRYNSKNVPNVGQQYGWERRHALNVGSTV